MNAATKLALAMLAAWAAGMALMAAGFGTHYRTGAVACGFVLAVGGLTGFAAIWRSRP